MINYFQHRLGARGFDYLISSLALRTDCLTASALGLFVVGELPLSEPSIWLSPEFEVRDLNAMRTSLGSCVKGSNEEGVRSFLHSLLEPDHLYTLYWTQDLKKVDRPGPLRYEEITVPVKNDFYLSSEIRDGAITMSDVLKEVISEATFRDRHVGFVARSSFVKGDDLKEWLHSSLVAVLVTAYDGDACVCAGRLEGKWATSDFKRVL